MTHLLYHTACPSCREEGADKTGNNLAIYADGHTFCYRCKYYTAGDKIQAYKNKLQTKEETRLLCLPEDADPSIPDFARSWLVDKYEFNQNTIVQNRILWSQQKELLIFPYYINGNLVGWQGRVFNKEEQQKRKWFSQGALDSFVYLLGKESPCLILTESIISAIKVSRFCQASPCFGSNISHIKWARLSHTNNKIILWYDPDKQKEAVEQAAIGRMYVPNVDVILSDKKPKDYSYDEIYTILNQTTS